MAAREGEGLIEYLFEAESLPDSPLEVAEMHLVEALNTPFRARIEVRSTDPNTDFASLLGGEVRLTVIRRREGQENARRLIGIVRSVEEGYVFRERVVSARLEVVPALRLLEDRRDTRIFQEKSVPEIVEEVLGEALGPYGREVENALSQTYPKREYTLQYNETDLDFVHRLLEEEGISYAFDHPEEGAEVVVLRDSNESFEALPNDDDGAVTCALSVSGAEHVSAVLRFELRRRSTTTGVAVSDFDWTRSNDLRVHAEGEGEDAQGRSRESYEARRALTIGAYDPGARRYTEEDSERQAGIRKEAYASAGVVASGMSWMIGFSPGITFELVGHPTPGLDGDYLLTRVEHRKGAAPGVETEIAYHNLFEALPLAVPYRPRRVTSKPRVSGMESAIVVGPSGEEIHTDEHGRVKIQLHWDRDGQRDDRSSCWVRVAQSWAGPGWGSFVLPRIGMEVLVSFLGGNPDRPVVTGCVYNTTNPPPLALPDDKTQMVFRSQSSPGGGGSNEIRFEDKANSEEFYLHAQKDFNELVENDHSTKVKANQSNVVDVNHSESVGGDQSLSVSGSRTKSVTGDESTAVDGARTETVKGDEKLELKSSRFTQITADEELLVGGGRRVRITAGEKIEVEGEEVETYLGGRRAEVRTHDILEVLADKNDHVTGEYNIVADARFKVKQGGDELLVCDEISGQSVGRVQLKNPGTHLEMDPGGTLTLRAASKIVLEVGGTKVEITPTEILVAAASKIQAGAGSGGLVLEGAGATVTGTKVSSSATAINEISGALVKIN